MAKKTKIYSTWMHMKQRCYNANYNHYADYGGRGIKVCDRWLKSENFIADMEPTMHPNLSLDRIDNEGDYEPSNCRWVDRFDQARNTSNSKWWWIDGVRYDSSSQAASILGVGKSTIQYWCKTRPSCYSEFKY